MPKERIEERIAEIALAMTGAVRVRLWKIFPLKTFGCDRRSSAYLHLRCPIRVQPEKLPISD